MDKKVKIGIGIGIGVLVFAIVLAGILNGWFYRDEPVNTDGEELSSDSGIDGIEVALKHYGLI